MENLFYKWDIKNCFNLYSSLYNWIVYSQNVNKRTNNTNNFHHATVCHANRTGCSDLYLNHVPSEFRASYLTLFCSDLGMKLAVKTYVYVNRQYHSFLVTFPQYISGQWRTWYLIRDVYAYQSPSYMIFITEFCQETQRYWSPDWPVEYVL